MKAVNMAVVQIARKSVDQRMRSEEEVDSSTGQSPASFSASTNHSFGQRRSPYHKTEFARLPRPSLTTSHDGRDSTHSVHSNFPSSHTEMFSLDPTESREEGGESSDTCLSVHALTSQFAETKMDCFRTETPPKSLHNNGAGSSHDTMLNSEQGVVTTVEGKIENHSVTPPINIQSSKPILYSAIGSLEEFTADSFGKLNQQHKLLKNKGFCKMQGPLIPPSRVETKVLIKPVRNKSSGSLSKLMDGQESPPGSQSMLVEEEKKDSPGSMEQNKPQHEDTTAKIRHVFSDDRTIRVDTKVGKKSRRRSKRVSINEQAKIPKRKEMFRPSCDAYTPRMEQKNIKYKPAEMRTPVQSMVTNIGTLARPNFQDALRRVSMILHQHIVKIENRFRNGETAGLFRLSMQRAFSEARFVTPRYKCAMVRIPMARPGMVYGMRKVKEEQTIPTEQEIYEFGHQLFKTAQLSPECSIVCLIYVERLMEMARVPLLASTWRPVFMCGLLMASKVWQDLSSWNVEFSVVYPQFSLEAINKLELEFLKLVKWDLYISSSLYAKYYFALRALVGKSGFRQRYNRMVGGVGSVDAMEALQVQKRTEEYKEQVTALHLSRSV